MTSGTAQRATEARGAAKFRTAAVVLLLTAGLGALIYLGWYSYQMYRPGMRYYLKGLTAMDQHHPLAARKYWQAGIKADPRFWRNYEKLGQFYAAALHYRVAGKYLLQATAFNPNDGNLQLEFSKVAHKAGRLDLSHKAGLAAVRLMPHNVVALGDYGLQLVEAHHRMEAVSYLKRAAAIKILPEYYIPMVSAEMDNGDMQQAQADLTTYLKLYPDDYQALILMASVYKAKPHTVDNMNMVLKYALHAGRVNPYVVNPYVLIGQVLVAANQPAKALKFFVGGLNIQPNNDTILYGLIQCYGMLGNTKARAIVLAHYNQVLRWKNTAAHLADRMPYDPQNLSALLKLANLEEILDHDQKALTYYKLAVIAAPKNKNVRTKAIAFCNRHDLPKLAAELNRPGYLPYIEPQ